MTRFDPANPPQIDFGGSGEFVHFLHANGFPPLTYREYLTKIAQQYHVVATETRPLQLDTDHEAFNDWWQISADFITYIQTHHQHPIIGIGHSIGAVVTMHAAIQRPDLFKKIVLLDPVFLPPTFSFMWTFARWFNQGHRHPLHGSAMRRRTEFESRTALFQKFKKARNFRNFTDESLRNYIEAITIENPDGTAVLSFKKEWEAQIYKTMPARIWRYVRKLTVPASVIYADKSDVMLAGSVSAMKKYAPQTVLHQIENASHLLPMEHPDLVAKVTLDFLS